MPGLLKVGYSLRDGLIRADELFTTGLPTEFEIIAQWLVDDPLEMEAKVHGTLQDVRVNSAREFFRLTPIAALKRINPLIEFAWNNLSPSGHRLCSIKGCNNIATQLFAGRYFCVSCDSQVRSIFDKATPEERKAFCTRYFNGRY